MSMDPFDALGRQLKEAVDARQSPTPRRRGLRRGSALLAALALAGGTTAALAAGVFRGHEASPGDAAIAQALNDVRDLPACQPQRGTRRSGQLVPGVADARLQADYGVFRRPTRTSDRLPSRLVRSTHARVLRDSVRVFRGPLGSRIRLYVTEGPLPYGSTDPVACVEATRDAALANLDPRDDEARTRVTRIMNGRVAAARRVTQPRVQSLFTFFGNPGNRGGSGGGGPLKDGTTSPRFGWSVGPRRTRVITGLAPDQVARIAVIDASGPVDERAKTVTGAVRSNAFYVVVPRRMGPESRLELRARNGRVVKKFRVRW